MKKKRAFTLIETLMSSGIFGFIAVIGISVAMLITWILYTGQVEMVNRSNLNEIVYYISREIQSAEGVRISPDGKTMEIKEIGSDKYNLKYSIVDNYPVDYLAFKDKRLLDVNADESYFSIEGDLVKLSLAVVKNDTDTSQQDKVVDLVVRPRSSVY